MKRWVGIVLLLAVLSFVSFYAYQILHKEEIAILESIVPDDVIYYVYSYNLDQKIKDFQSHPLFKQISTSEVYSKFVNPGLERIKEKVPFLPELIKKDTAAALFSVGNAGPKNNFEDFLFLARIDSAIAGKIKKAIADFYLTFIAKSEVSYKKYNGVKITSCRFPKERIINYAILSDVIIFSNSSDIMQESIDLFKNKSQNNLSQDKNFQKLKMKVKKESLLWGFGNIKNYYNEMLKAYASQSLKSQEPKGIGPIESLMKITPFINLTKVLEAYVFYIDYDEFQGTFVFKSYQAFNKAMDKENFLDVIAYGKGIDRNTLNLIPRDIMAYCGGSQDLLNYWGFLKQISLSAEEMMKAQMQSDPRYHLYKDQLNAFSFENSLNSLESFLGVSIEKDILPLLGNNFGTVLVNVEDVDIPANSADAQQNFPMIFPQFYSFMELKDTAKMQIIMEDITKRIIDSANKLINLQEQAAEPSATMQAQQQNEQVAPAQQEKEFLKFRADNYNGINIYIIDMLEDFPLDNFRVNYCFLDKYMLVSLSPQLTRKIIEVYKNPQRSFTGNWDFEVIQKNMPPNYSNIIFLDFKKTIKDIRATKFFAELQTYLLGFQKGLSKPDLDLILDTFSNISTFIFTSSLLDAETMESTFCIKLQNP